MCAHAPGPFGQAEGADPEIEFVPSMKTNRFAAVLFDLDGTLIDTAPDLVAALNWAMAKQGLKQVAGETIRSLIGDGARAMIRKGFALTGTAPEASRIETALTDFLSFYEAHIADLSQPFAGAEECLGQLKARGLKLGLCTNKSERLSRKLMGILGLADHFAVVAGGDSFPERKPHPGHLLRTLEKMRADPQTAVMVGDSANDGDAARGAGLPFVAVSFGYGPSPAATSKPDRVITRLAELPQALDELARLPPWP
jgi:phosphoglycolate phosphatase